MPSTLPDPLRERFALIEAEYQLSLAAPLSRRKALLVAVLLDDFADRAFAAWRREPERVFGAADPIAFRAELARRSEALAAVFTMGNQTATLRLDSVAVPIADYPKLGVEDFMVSLYNGNTVQRVMLVRDGTEPVLAHPLINDAIAFWRRFL